MATFSLLEPPLEGPGWFPNNNNEKFRCESNYRSTGLYTEIVYREYSRLYRGV